MRQEDRLKRTAESISKQELRSLSLNPKHITANKHERP